MTNYTFTITQRKTQRKGIAFDLYVKIEGRTYRPVLGYNAEPKSGVTLKETQVLYWDTMQVQGRGE